MASSFPPPASTPLKNINPRSCSLQILIILFFISEVHLTSCFESVKNTLTQSTCKICIEDELLSSPSLPSKRSCWTNAIKDDNSKWLISSNPLISDDLIETEYSNCMIHCCTLSFATSNEQKWLGCENSVSSIVQQRIQKQQRMLGDHLLLSDNSSAVSDISSVVSDNSSSSSGSTGSLNDTTLVIILIVVPFLICLIVLTVAYFVNKYYESREGHSNEHDSYQTASIHLQDYNLSEIGPLRIDLHEVCPICLDNNPTLSTKCKHSFHPLCLKEWIHHRLKCPSCNNRDLNPVKIYCCQCQTGVTLAILKPHSEVNDQWQQYQKLECSECKAKAPLRQYNQPQKQIERERDVPFGNEGLVSAERLISM